MIDASQNTSWRLILESCDPASDVARAAMEDFARVYWLPVYGHVRRRTGDPERALDLTQEFFATWFEKRWADAADPARGRFRTFLFVVLDRFLSGRHDHEQAAKRGGGLTRVPLDAVTAERLLAGPDDAGRSPADAFTQRWALALLRECLDCLRESLSSGRKSVHYQIFVRFYELDSRARPADYPTLAREFGVSESDITNTLHRARADFRRLLEERILRSVESPSEVRAEIDELFRSLSC